MLDPDHPVADIMLRIGTETVEPARGGQRMPRSGIRLMQSGDHLLVGQIAQPQSAALA